MKHDPTKTSIPSLARAVKATVGSDYIEDLASHGADAGFPGITYYNDTIAFFKRHREDIVKLVNDSASELSEEPIVLVRSFRCLHGHSMNEITASIARCLYSERLSDSNDSLDYIVANALCWFACEEMARQMCPDL